LSHTVAWRTLLQQPQTWWDHRCFL
jgi:hypothetical protein